MRSSIFSNAESVFKISGNTCPATQRHISEELNSQAHLSKHTKIRKKKKPIGPSPAPLGHQKSPFPLSRLRKETLR